MNATQNAVCSLMIASSFNDFNPEKIIADLLLNEDKWIGFIWGRWGYLEMIPLRDIQADFYNADTLWIRVKNEYLNWIKECMVNWKAHEFSYWKKGLMYDYGDIEQDGADKDKEYSRLGVSEFLDESIYVRLSWD